MHLSFFTRSNMNNFHGHSLKLLKEHFCQVNEYSKYGSNFHTNVVIKELLNKYIHVCFLINLLWLSILLSFLIGYYLVVLMLSVHYLTSLFFFKPAWEMKCYNKKQYVEDWNISKLAQQTNTYWQSIKCSTHLYHISIIYLSYGTYAVVDGDGVVVVTMLATVCSATKICYR